MEIIAITVAAIGAFFAAIAALAARETVQLTKEMRWQADVRRVLDALVATRRTATTIVRSWDDPRGANLDNSALFQQLDDDQRELDRALAFPWPVTENVELERLLERLRTAELGSSHLDLEPDVRAWATKLRNDAATAELLLPTRPPFKKMPGLYIRLITFRVRRRAARRERGEGRGVDSQP